MSHCRSIVCTLGTLAGCTLSLTFAQAQSTYVKVADEWATIQPGGPRAPQFGNRNWNIEGGDLAAFASTGTLRFYMADLVERLNADFPGGWQIDNVTLVVEHDDAGFSDPGGVSIFHFSNDELAITNGMDSVFMGSAPDSPPGNFGSLTPSSLVFDDTGTSDGQPVRVLLNDFVSMADMGEITRVNDYTFGEQGDHNLDVFGTPGSVVNPAGAITAMPDYGLSFPGPNADDTLANFNSELTTDQGDWISAGLDAIIADIEDGMDALSFIFSPTDSASTVAATYRGNPFGDPPLSPPRIYLQVSSTGTEGVLGDYNNNGSVDAADYVLWRNDGPLANEGDNPGVVNLADYEYWRARFGAVSGSGGGLLAVPEPSLILLMLLALNFGPIVVRLRQRHGNG
jgi:hypothetical protein